MRTPEVWEFKAARKKQKNLGCFLDTPYVPVRKISRSTEREMRRRMPERLRRVSLSLSLWRAISYDPGTWRVLSGSARKKPSFPSCHSVLRRTRRAAGEFAGHPSDALPDVARDRQRSRQVTRNWLVAPRIPGAQETGGKKVDGDTGRRTAALC